MVYSLLYIANYKLQSYLMVCTKWLYMMGTRRVKLCSSLYRLIDDSISVRLDLYFDLSNPYVYRKHGKIYWAELMWFSRFLRVP